MTAARDDLHEFDALLTYLKTLRGLNLTGYKRAGLLRRFTKRMRAIGVPSFAAYMAYLEAHPDEVTQLLNTVLINLTAFFRDELPWDYMRAEIVPRILEAKGPGEPVRVWCAGCATGEEAYSLAIVFAEALGHEQFRERVKVYATDLDAEALAEARQGTYPERDVAELPTEIAEKYFERRDQRFVFRKDLRRSVIFGLNNLMKDAPISRVDLIACRNTLMYFDAATQAAIMTRFHFALNDGGYLFLGRAETLLTHQGMFAPVDLRQRVFTKVRRAGPRERQAMARAGALTWAERADTPLRDAAFDASTVAQFAVDRGGTVILVNDRARALLRVGPSDVGRPLQDLEISYRPFDLRSLLDEAYVDARTVTQPAVAWRTPSGEERWFDIIVAPLGPTDAGSAGASISFIEVTQHRQLQQQLEESQTELESAYQELQTTNEELETTNEELHSTVEELETTNEELQSTNEELETMNEELQSTNEELHAINDELRDRSEELNRANALLASVFASLRQGVAVLDREMRVLVWNARAEDLWGLRLSEVAHVPFVNLDIGLPVERLVPQVRASLADGAGSEYDVTLRATNRRGRVIDCRVTIAPLLDGTADDVRGVIVLMEEQPADAGDAPGLTESDGGRV